ncbi:hypothetical protein QE372_001897 [Agrobacterium pusense]|uniref:calcium-binding protein n=1 Tax=Agrobacterium pusense TaxID=648995 RepID=UPI0028655E74|nr:calcium-binding protein [Agrobacterium pusense]MDR6189629.1 hypothetical protein [Agrobacterium pusense]
MAQKTDDLFVAILAMDAYNRGVSPGLAVVGDRIGSATILNDTRTLSGSTIEQYERAGVYGIAYDTGSEKIISYRGTDQLISAPWSDSGSDIWNSYGMALGHPFTAAARLATEFYQAITGTEQTDPSKGSAILTGHSMGGGLAGFIGAIYRQPAVLFDNMTFQAAAEKAYALASKTISISLTPNDVVAQELRADLYNGQYPVPAADLSRIKTYWVEGEFLAPTRTLQATAKISLNPYGGSVLDAVKLHSQALLVMLKFAQNARHQAWSSIGDSVLTALFNDDVGKAAGFSGEEKTGHYDESDKMMNAIAYSALQDGGLVYGNTAIRAMFDDLDELGKAVKNTPSSNGGTSTRTLAQEISTALSAIVIQYAGQLAAKKDTQKEDPEGVARSGSGFVAISTDRFAPGWKTVQQGGDAPSAPERIQGLEMLLEILKRDPSDRITPEELSQPPRPEKWIGNIAEEALTKKIGEITSVIVSDGAKARIDAVDSADIFANTDLQSQSGKPKSFAMIGSSSNDTLVGSSRGDVIVGGPGDDMLIGGNGRDTIYGGDGEDTLVGGRKVNEEDHVSDDLIGGNGHDTYMISSPIYNGTWNCGGYDDRDIFTPEGGFNDEVFSYIDIISDSDGDIYVSGEKISGEWSLYGSRNEQVFYYNSQLEISATTRYYSSQGTLTPYLVFFSGTMEAPGASLFAIHDFQDGELGINIPGYVPGSATSWASSSSLTTKDLYLEPNGKQDIVALGTGVTFISGGDEYDRLVWPVANIKTNPSQSYHETGKYFPAKGFSQSSSLAIPLLGGFGSADMGYTFQGSSNVSYEPSIEGIFSPHQPFVTTRFPSATPPWMAFANTYIQHYVFDETVYDWNDDPFELVIIKIGSASWQYTKYDSEIGISYNLMPSGSLKITGSGGVVFIDDFKEGDFGIRFFDYSYMPAQSWKKDQFVDDDRSYRPINGEWGPFEGLRNGKFKFAGAAGVNYINNGGNYISLLPAADGSASAGGASGGSSGGSNSGSNGSGTAPNHAGNKTSNGGAGDDSYSFGRGDGNNTIVEAKSEGSSDTLKLVELAFSDVVVSRQGNDLIISVPESSTGTVAGSVLIKNTLLDDDAGVENFVFTDWTYSKADMRSELLSKLVTPGNDVIEGFENTADYLEGGAGSDTFVFKPNFGWDTIADFAAGAGTEDIIEFQGGIFADFEAVLAAASQVGNDTIINVDGTHGITIANVSLSDLHRDDVRLVA